MVFFFISTWTVITREDRLDSICGCLLINLFLCRIRTKNWIKAICCVSLSTQSTICFFLGEFSNFMKITKMLFFVFIGRIEHQCLNYEIRLESELWNKIVIRDPRTDRSELIRDFQKLFGYGPVWDFQNSVGSKTWSWIFWSHFFSVLISVTSFGPPIVNKNSNSK